VNAELDENGVSIIYVEYDGEDDEEQVYAESLCQPDQMLNMLELLLAFQLSQGPMVLNSVHLVTIGKRVPATLSPP